MRKQIFGHVFVLIGALILQACFDDAGSGKKEKPVEKDIVKDVEKIDVKVAENITKLLDYTKSNNARLNDSVLLQNIGLTDTAYQKNEYRAYWSKDEKWLPIADSLTEFINRSKEYGLFPSDYHVNSINFTRRIFNTDSLSRKNAVLWARADVIFTNAYLTIARHLKLGRLQRDSVTLRNDSLITGDLFLENFYSAISEQNITGLLQSLEPVNPGYHELKAGIKSFIDSVEFSKLTYIKFPNNDSIAFIAAVQKRLKEGGYLDDKFEATDTSAFAAGIKKYQAARNFKMTGKVSETLVRSLNNTNWEKFKRIAVNLDRYKMLPDTLPSTRVWVNLPSYVLQVYDADTVTMQSKVIVGSPKTRTPLLSSSISNFITMPQWTVPYSIIFKEMLPQIQKNIGYLDKQNLMVVDKNDSVINPATINWAKLSKTNFPYLLRQRQGDDNSLGVIKFNFANKYSVYLHDTNARWLFSKSLRALSHGCVRVQDWEKLSSFLVRNDSLQHRQDSVKVWIQRQEKHVVTGFPRVPVYFRYLTIEGKDGKLKWYEDIYGEDRILCERYFADKPVN